MLRYKRIKSPIIPSGEETVFPMLAGQTGKNRKIVSISTIPLLDMWVRVYRDADLIVDIHSKAITDGSPLLPMDLNLAEGQQLMVGFYNDGAVDTPKNITIGYTETG